MKRKRDQEVFRYDTQLSLQLRHYVFVYYNYEQELLSVRLQHVHCSSLHADSDFSKCSPCSYFVNSTFEDGDLVFMCIFLFNVVANNGNNWSRCHSTDTGYKTCDNGLCLPGNVTCTGVDYCMDGSTSRTLCGRSYAFR